MIWTLQEMEDVLIVTELVHALIVEVVDISMIYIVGHAREVVVVELVAVTETF